MVRFEELKLTRQYLNALEDLGFEQATAIQIKAIPAIRSGQHVIGIAQTGTGKTAAYVLPILQRLGYAKGIAARCIILVPTKELVVQVRQQIEELAKYTDIRFEGIYGGVGRKAQAKAIHDGVDIIVTTPRRLLELYEKENIKLNKIEIMVMDEADRMMDMGFMGQINTILEVVPTKKQNLLFSATFSPKVEELSWNFMDFPIKIEITPEATPVETVEQVRYDVPNFLTKLNLLTHLLEDEEAFNRIIVFVKTKQSANQIFNRLQKYGKENVRLIHSNKGQNTRINAFQDFKEGKIRILVATDVMARGIDIKDVSHVINFDVPTVYEDYVHRIGRTGRAFRTGAAITFVTKADVYHIHKIEKKIRMAIPMLNMPASIEITETPFFENQEMERAIDAQKHKEDPTYQGAFHEKKSYKAKIKNKQSKRPKKYTGKTNSGYISKANKGKRTSSKKKRHKK
ncbi:DEAD/DEAH box helicase [Aureispira anguillae]|uniref:DEAD/DEAH box helicase n=1 Tax=Aureispira anguillae TaxID=2864201 RepID=A0A915YI09_9BACT|nr:DEAD/DEAH box helicase [Aureispira anguillae]BDS13565.1 DEAD/DEAH box helicase [Aureispira anguillae]